MRFLPALLLVTATFTHASDLTVKTTSVSCEGKDEYGRYEYQLGLIVQNIGKDEITIITKPNSMSTLLYETPELTLDNSETKINKVPIIPPESELGIVVLQPNDGAQIYRTTKERKPLADKVVVAYQGSAIYGGRYGNWVGLVKGEPTTVYDNDKCKP
ncbi:hypothetical protein NBRC116494_00080 [Aurantivibrio plasticivorans]